jgi:N-acetyl-alpha-D-muramate 1-phosphate uridylyltransferase
MADSLAGVVLAAGAGNRLAPLTRLLPKAMCPVANRPLVDHALERLGREVTIDPDHVAVNVHHGRWVLEPHLYGRAHLSIEEQEPLGTAGALGFLRPWLAGRPVLLTNADVWLPEPPTDFVSGWDGDRVRLLGVRDPARPDFGPLRYCGMALLPAAVMTGLGHSPSGLYEALFRAAWERGSLDLVEHHGEFLDCGTPAEYLAANLAASGGASVIGEGAWVSRRAYVERSVIWPEARVGRSERLVDAIRATYGVTVLVR